MDASTDAPRLPLAEATALADSLYGLSATARPLPSYRDANFALEVEGEPRAVLKLVHPDTPAERVQAWIAAHDAAEATGGLPVPRVLSNREGQRSAFHELPDGRRSAVYAVSWVEGHNLGAIDPRDRPLGLWPRLGRALAALGDSLSALDEGLLEGDPRWDLRRADWILDHLEVHPDAARRERIEGIALQFLGRVLPRMSELPEGVLHGDANDHNLLLRGEGDDVEISGILDFGDLTTGPRVFELAIAAAYAIFGHADPRPVLEALVRGWCEVRSLEEAEIEVFMAALEMRLAVSVTASAIESRARPDEAYLTVSQVGAWAALDALGALASTEIRGALDRAAGREAASPEHDHDDLLARRARLLPRNLSLSYARPLLILRGRGPYLYDETGRAHLDGVNNVAHVGHAHPRVVRAIAEQAALLNTNTRYLHPTILDYAERLLATFPEPLEVVSFVNSGSEANELALRMARAATGRRSVAVLDWAYHGHTGALIDLSPYKHARAGGQGAPDWVHVAPLPDLYRGRYRRGRDDDAVGRYLADFEASLEGAGDDLAAFFAESIPSCGGQIVLPEGYLAGAHERVRARGGVCVADEVQVGFGRVGRHWWAFEEHGVVPDIVTLGKPIGDGHPLAAVVCTRAVAESFANGMEYFATFGGNPVSAAAGRAVLEVIEDEGLRARAARTGEFLLAGFHRLAARHPRLGEVRGRGLFLGLEFVADPEARTPDAAAARAVVEAMGRIGVLLSTDGPDENVIKIKPPLVFGRDEARLLLSGLERVLDEVLRS